MLSRRRYLLQNTIIFAIGNLATRLISFFLIPLYTFSLNTEQYGQVDLLFTICSFLYPLATLNIAEAIFRFSMDKDKNDNKIISSGVLCIICSLFVNIIISFFVFASYKNVSLTILFYLYLSTLSMTQVILALVKGQEKLKLFTSGNIINTITIALFSLLFLVTLRLGVSGYFLAYIFANIMTSCFILLKGNVFKNYKYTFDKKYFQKMIKYSTVLIPTSFMWWIMNSSDKVMISTLISTAANGVYAISYKIPSLLTMLASIFNQAWVFSAISEKDKRDNEEYTNRVFSLLLYALCLATIIITVVTKSLISLITPEEYFEAWKYTPILLFGFIFMTLATFISASYNAHKDSKGFLYSGLIGAISNIILNAILIPVIGVYGAAIATMVSYITVFIYRIIDTRKYISIKVNLKHIIILILSAISCVVIYFSEPTMYISFVIEIIALWIVLRKDFYAVILGCKNSFKRKIRSKK